MVWQCSSPGSVTWGGLGKSPSMVIAEHWDESLTLAGPAPPPVVAATLGLLLLSSCRSWHQWATSVVGMGGIWAGSGAGAMKELSRKLVSRLGRLLRWCTCWWR